MKIEVDINLQQTCQDDLIDPHYSESAGNDDYIGEAWFRQ